MGASFLGHLDAQTSLQAYHQPLANESHLWHTWAESEYSTDVSGVTNETDIQHL
jgi:hypothetical protein